MTRCNATLAILLAVGLSVAQEPAPQPTIKITTHLVQLSVLVHNKKGEPVSDLKQEDFTVFDKGKEQKIRYFAIERRIADGPAHAALPAGIYSNKVGGDPQHPTTIPNSLTVILLDGLNTRITDQAATKDSLVKFLNQLQPNDRVAIYTLASELRVLHDFTSDTASLLRAINRSKNAHSGALSASSFQDQYTSEDAVDKAFDAWVNQSQENTAAFMQGVRTERTLNALEAIAHHLAGTPGRKNLIWLSGGFPLYVGLNADGSKSWFYQSFSDAMRRTVRALNDVGIAIYPVDARGLMGVWDLNPSMGPAAGGVPRSQLNVRPGDIRANDLVFNTQGAMREVAERTGGRAYMNSNDIAGAVRSSLNDSAVSYVISYSPSHDEWNGQFREIKVKVNRSGVDVRNRSGYYAIPADPDDSKVRQASLQSAANGPLMATGLSILARVVDKPTAENPHAAVRMVLQASELAFAKDAKNNWIADVDLLMLVRDDQGALLNHTNRNLHLSFTQQQYDAFLKSGIALNADMDAPVKSTRTRLVVRDVVSGVVGSVDLPLK